MMSPDPSQVHRSGISEALAAADGLTMLSQVFGRVSGREMSADALACIIFLQENGSPDLVRKIIAGKEYQTSVKELGEFAEKISAASAHKEMLEAQAKASQASRI